MLIIFNIQRYSIHDGAGVRTNIFFKGCPLKCLWCNNPESLESSPSVMFDERLCHQFGECIKAAPDTVIIKDKKLFINRDLLSDTASLYDVCPSKAITVSGKEKSVEELLFEIEKDIPFYQMSDGGVTLTGGEPFAQGPELKDLIVELNNRAIHVSAETSLHLPWEAIEEYAELVDLLLADLKHIDNEKFTKYTGGSATLVTDNFKKLDATGRKFIVRMPVIPGFNSSDKELKILIDFASGLKNAIEINFIPFHALAKEKYLMLGLDYRYGNYRSIDKATLYPYVKYAEDRGITAKILN